MTTATGSLAAALRAARSARLRSRSPRVRKNATQVEVARRVGVRQSTISAWERGGDSPTAGRLRNVAYGYRLPLSRVRALWLAQQAQAARIA